MAITTMLGHVNRAKDFYNKESMYFALGRSSAWEDEMSPPNEDAGAVALDEVIGYKRYMVKQIVRPVKDGETADIKYKNEDWKVISEEDALDEGARWVYLDTTIEYDEIPLGFYRQVGLFTGLKVASDVPEGKYNLTVSEVEDEGILEVIDNRQPSNRQADQTEKISLILEF